MSELNITRFRFNSINPQVNHTDNTRLDLPEESSYLNVHIEFELPEYYLSQYENLDYVFVEKWGDDNHTIKVKYDENVVHNHITQSVYSFVQDNHENPSLIYDMQAVLSTLHLWKIQ